MALSGASGNRQATVDAAQRGALTTEHVLGMSEVAEHLDLPSVALAASASSATSRRSAASASTSRSSARRT